MPRRARASSQRPRSTKSGISTEAWAWEAASPNQAGASSPPRPASQAVALPSPTRLSMSGARRSRFASPRRTSGPAAPKTTMPAGTSSAPWGSPSACDARARIEKGRATRARRPASRRSRAASRSTSATRSASPPPSSAPSGRSKPASRRAVRRRSSSSSGPAAKRAVPAANCTEGSVMPDCRSSTAVTFDAQLAQRMPEIGTSVGTWDGVFISYGGARSMVPRESFPSNRRWDRTSRPPGKTKYDRQSLPGHQGLQERAIPLEPRCARAAHPVGVPRAGHALPRVQGPRHDRVLRFGSHSIARSRRGGTGVGARRGR